MEGRCTAVVSSPTPGQLTANWPLSLQIGTGSELTFKLIPHMFDWRKSVGTGWPLEDLNIMQAGHRHVVSMDRGCGLKDYQGFVLSGSPESLPDVH